MKEIKLIEQESTGARDALTEMLRNKSRELIAEALEAEIEELIEKFRGEKTVGGEARVVRNGHLPERRIQTGIGEIEVKVPRVRDRKGLGVSFHSKLLPPYMRRTKSVEELVPWLYLKGVSSNNFEEALGAILGEGAKGLSPSNVCRLKGKWDAERREWEKRSLAEEEYVYVWVDGIYSGVRESENDLCALVMIGVNKEGEKVPLALRGGYRESAESWRELLRDLKERGFKGSKLAIGDGALGFWKALREIYPETKEQRCWQHKIQNVLDKLPDALQDKAKWMLKNIWMAQSKAAAMQAYKSFKSSFGAKYKDAVDNLAKDLERLLTFYDFPAEHWKSLRTTNPIESVFSTIRSRLRGSKGCLSREATLSLMLQLLFSAKKSWKRLWGFKKLAEVIEGVIFTDGLAIKDSLVTEVINKQEDSVANATNSLVA
jgi:transposase-like protein